MDSKPTLVEPNQADWDAAIAFGRSAGGVDSSLLATYFARHRIDVLDEALRVVREARSCMLDLPAQSYADKAIKHKLLDKIDAFIAQHEGEES